MILKFFLPIVMIIFYSCSSTTVNFPVYRYVEESYNFSDNQDVIIEVDKFGPWYFTNKVVPAGTLKDSRTGALNQKEIIQRVNIGTNIEDINSLVRLKFPNAESFKYNGHIKNTKVLFPGLVSEIEIKIKDVKIGKLKQL